MTELELFADAMVIYAYGKIWVSNPELSLIENWNNFKDWENKNAIVLT